MMEYLIEHLLMVMPTMLGITVAVSRVFRLLPGGPIALLFPHDSSIDEVREVLMDASGLDQPLHEPHVKWTWQKLQGYGGASVLTDRLVLPNMLAKLQVCIEPILNRCYL